MRRAIELSAKGFPAPNPHVGCVIAQGRSIVGEGYHEHAGGPHAEVVALQQAGANSNGATAYVTLEPCNHFGRTPPCSEALIAAKVRRVVIAVSEPNATAQGSIMRLRGAGIEVQAGVLTSEAREANQAWLYAYENGKAYVVLKSAISIDGKIATSVGESKWITGEESRAEGHRLRAECGAVLVGRGTVQADSPQLTVRSMEVMNQPLKIVLDPWRKLPATHPTLAGALRIVGGEAKPEELQINLKGGKFDLNHLRIALFQKGITSVLVEGGAKTVSHFIEQQEFNRLELFVSGRLIGSGKPWFEAPLFGPIIERPELRFQTVRQRGSDLQLSLVPQKS